MFWRDFFHIFGVNWKDVAIFELAVKKFGGAQGFIDCFWKGKLVIEHKSRGKSLTSAFNQAVGYLDTLSSEEKPRYVIVSDFDRIRLVDLFTTKKKEIHLIELTDNIQMFKFIYEDDVHHHQVQEELNIDASELMGALHDSLKNDGYNGKDLELFLIRLLFCVYAEDTGIFEPYQFTDYVCREEDPMTVGMKIQMLFRILNQSDEERQSNLTDELKSFPYVNGKLFETPIVPPNFDNDMYNDLKTICNFDWSTISPAIFGSLFQSIMDSNQRRELGAHYTSESNILKIINSLFMNNLWNEFYQAKGKTSKLKALWDKIAKLEFFDPACGCGNFLIVAYKELRLLEYEILAILLDEDKKQVRFDSRSLSKIKLEHFHGVEIEEFPSLIAKVSMWLIQHQMDLKYETLDIHENNLPLKSSADIHNANSLRIDWSDVVTPSNNLYVLGNPPFVGSRNQTKEQKADMKLVFNKMKGVGLLDYVSAWYRKAAEYIQGTTIKCAFVSTNSICQGDQVGILWENLLNDFKININFAHQYFKWSNEAKNNAAVFVVIIGFSLVDADDKFIYTYETVNSEPTREKVKNINPYLVEGDDIIIKSRKEPISNVSNIMKKGSKAYDYGFLTIKNEEEKQELESENPHAKKFIKKFLSASDFLNNRHRYCLWLVDATPSDFKQMPLVIERIKNVKAKREKSSDKGINRLAETPALFENNQPNGDFLTIPVVSSGTRKYIPMGFLDKDIIVTNALYTYEGASLYDFAILTSKMHMLWVELSCGKLKGDYRYSKKLAYNNFPFPKNIPSELKIKIGNAGKEILNVRNNYPNESLANLYDPLLMPVDLRKAHEKLDKLVDKAYRNKKFKDDNDRMKFLFDLYLEYVEPE